MVLIAGVASGWAADASARCVIETPALAVSYPDASTEAVPPDAVFWLVPKLGSAQVRLDGVELAPLGSSPAERYQFRPEAPLSLGEHQLDVRISPIIAGDESEPQDVRLAFTVADLAYRSGDVGSLTAQRISNTSGERATFAWPDACRNNTFLAGQCNDIGTPADDWLFFAPIGEPLFYLVNGVQLVAVGCERTMVRVRDPESVVPHEIAAVLPTGVAPLRVVEGRPDAEEVEGRPDAEEVESENGGMCSLAPSAPGSSPRWASLAALVALAVLCTRRGAR